MEVSYSKLWALMRERRLRKKDLGMIAGISSASVTKLAKGKNVTTDILCKICAALCCGFDDIMELVDDSSRPLRRKSNG